MTVLRCCASLALLWLFSVSSAEAQCSYSVSPTSFAVGSTATTRTVSVVTGTQCSWTSTSADSWITISSGATGTGLGNATFAVQQNSTGAARTGTVTIAGQTITVTQDVNSCTYSVSPLSFSVDALSTTRTVSIVSGTQCTWGATSTANWITVTSGATGAGIGNVTFSIAANSGAARTGTVTIAGQTVTVNQTSASTGCTYSVTPLSFSVDALSTTRTVSIVSGTQCTWSATSTANWITVTSAATGAGIGNVTFSIAANSGAARTGFVAIAGQTVTVNQTSASTGCTYSVSPLSFSVDALSTTRAVSIVSGTQCAWGATSTVNWITVTSGATGAGIGNVTFSIAANSGAARTGTVTIAGQTVTVNQAGTTITTPPAAPQNLRIVTEMSYDGS